MPNEYTLHLERNRETMQPTLNKLIDQYAIHVVGRGYIDIIVVRDRYQDFLGSLTDHRFVVECVSWWCLASEENKKRFGCPHGGGGPMTSLGWFSEVYQEFDEVDEEIIVQLEQDFAPLNIEKVNRSVAEIIENKMALSAAGDPLTFEHTECLTPGFWVRVPDIWNRLGR